SKKGKRDKAIDAAQNSLKAGLKSESKVRISEGYRILSQTYEAFDKLDSALFYQKKYTEIEKKILVDRHYKKLTEAQAKLDTEIKNLRIQNLEKEKTISRNHYMLLIGFILIGILLTSIFMYRRWSTIRLKKKELEMELDKSK